MSIRILLHYAGNNVHNTFWMFEFNDEDGVKRFFHNGRSIENR